MQYQYLRGFPVAILPRLEIIVISAERAHPLTGHGGIRTAVADVTAFAVRAFGGCANVLCDAVAGGHIAYVDLSPHLDIPPAGPDCRWIWEVRHQALARIRTRSEP